MSGHEHHSIVRWFTDTVLTVAGALVLDTAALGAQQSCVQRPIGVPPFGSPPNWWDSGQPPYAYAVRDPRWDNSLAITYGTGTAEQALFRSLADNAFLYLSWEMKVNEEFDPDGDVLHIVFGSVSGTPSSGDPDIRLEVWPLQSSAATPFASSVNDVPVRVVVATRVAPQGTWTDMTPPPDWI